MQRYSSFDYSRVHTRFEDYSIQLGIWRKIFVDIENDFVPQDKQIAESISVAFEKAGFLQNSSIQLDEHSSMNVIDWVHKFKYILFDPDIKNANQLYEQLIEFAKLTPDAHERWLNSFNKTDLYRTMAWILPHIRDEFNTRISFNELKSEHQKLKESIEKLKYALEEKLK